MRWLFCVLLLLAGAACAATTIDRVLVEKSERRMSLLDDGAVVKTYRIALGREPVGDKERQGDGRTPEGTFRIDRRNAASQYHRSLHIDYPDAAHRARARRLGVSPGGDIFIHGLPNGAGWLVPRGVDWTAGCIAVSNDEIEEIWTLVRDGTPIEIRP
jgi:murein L,D-transpeptidase YafK